MIMSAAAYDFIVEQGTTHKFKLVYKDYNKEPKDITGWDVRGHIKRKISDCDYLAEFTFKITNPVQGEISVILPASTFEGHKFKANRHDDHINLVYDVELYKKENDEEEVIRLLNGTIKLSPEVTK